VISKLLLFGGLTVLVACGDRVSLGGGGQGGEGAEGGVGQGLQPGTGATGGMGFGGGSPGESCLELPCGEPCDLAIVVECPDEDCPVSLGFCNEFGECTEAFPLCGEPCGDAPCGVSCLLCEAGPDDPPCLDGYCDQFGFCSPEVVCEEPMACEIMGLACGESCSPCEGWFPIESCPYWDDPSPFFVCDGDGYCAPSDAPVCPQYDSCVSFGLPMCEPCTNCAPNDPTCPPEVPKFCDVMGICTDIVPPGCP